MNDTVIRNFTKDDLLQISEIEQLSINPAWSYNAIFDFSQCETSRILVADLDNRVSGYITYSVVLDEVQIANVAVHPDFRRRGIAERLLKTLCEKSKNENMAFITLEVRLSNEPAIQLYKKCGYYECGIRKGYYSNPKEDAVLMNYTLS